MYSENCRVISDGCTPIEHGKNFHSCQGCHYFAQCSHGILYRMACPAEDLVFNYDAQICADSWITPTCNLSNGKLFSHCLHNDMFRNKTCIAPICIE